MLNEDAIREWTSRVPPPWVMKPRGQAAAVGISKIHSADELWRAIDAAGDAFAEYVLEQFVPGDVYHVDSIAFERQVRFAVASRYTTPPVAVAHQGRIFATRSSRATSPSPRRSARLTCGCWRASAWSGASHTEFIRAHSGEWYFLETSARRAGIAAEDPPEDTAWVARHLDVAPGRMTFWRRPILLDPKGLAQIRETVKRGGYGFVFISSWQAVVRGLIRDENDNAGAVRVIEDVKASARATSIPWLID